MASGSAWQRRMAVKCWQAAGEKAVINFRFLMNTEVKSKFSINSLYNSLNTGLFFFIFDQSLHLSLMIQRRLTFNRTEKLKSSKLISQIFKEGKSFSHFPFRVLYIYPGKNKAHLQAGFSMSSKNFKKAVDRNKIKRLMREAYRLQKPSLQEKLQQSENYLAVFIIYTGNELPVYKNVYEKMGGLLQRLEKIVSNNDAHSNNEIKNTN